jgi:cytochrome c oxidase accessory protein FixG
VKATTDNLYQYDDEFRDTMSTVDAKGKRIWIYPKKPHGKLHHQRVVVSIVLLALFFSGPFVTIGGQPLLLLNFFERKFVIFGQAFWPQDFFLLALTLIIFFVFIILFTVVFGRIWCGWICPQTVFMEMVFRKIEYWIEGDANAQRRLDHAPWSINKIVKKSSKQLIFIIISVLISHVAMAYLIGIEQVKEIVSQSPIENLSGFIGLVAFTGIFYGVFARFREQACITVCPYGRLQGVLLGRESIVVAYDWLRGEPRGKIKKHEVTTTKGDCIDCKLCVHVCPTGIDIRNGTQLECVNCTACIDACDDVMLKIGKPKGLIRFASFNSIKEGIQKIITTRVVAYSFVLVALLGLWSFLIFTRSDVETTVLKIPGTLYQRTDDGAISNLYNIEFVNKTFEDIVLEAKVISPATAQLSKVGEQKIVVPAGEMLKSVYFIKIPAEAVKQAKTTIILGIYQNGSLLEKVNVKFIGPVHSHKDRTKGR